MDDDGDLIESCVVTQTGLPVISSGSRRRPTGRWERLLMEVVDEIAQTQTAGIEVEHVIAEVLRRTDAPQGKQRDSRKYLVNRALKNLSAGDQPNYAVEDGCISIL